MTDEAEMLSQTNALLRAIHDDLRDLTNAVKRIARSSA